MKRAEYLMRAFVFCVAMVCCFGTANAAEADSQEPSVAENVPPPSPIQTEADRKSHPAGDTSPKAIVDAFNQMAFFDHKPIEAIKKYLSPDFIERSPDAGHASGDVSDRDAILNYFETRGWKPNDPKRDVIYQVLADGDRVAVFHHVIEEPGVLGTAYVDIFRVKDGIIVEHWAIGEPVPANVSPRHSMF